MPDNTTPHPSAIETPFSDIEDIVADVRDGKMVIMVDDEDRENEGDLIMAAELVRPEDVNYMATHGRGLICLTLAADGVRDRRSPRDELYDLDRSGRGNHNRHFGARSRSHDPCGREAGCAPRRPQAARPHIPRHGAAGRRPDARRAYRSRL
jgi:hypothetical protein